MYLGGYLKNFGMLANLILGLRMGPSVLSKFGLNTVTAAPYELA